MNEELRLQWIDEVVRKFSFSKRVLAWDSYEAHMTDVKQRLIAVSIESVIIPQWCTKYIQATDVVWNKSFKEKITKFYGHWLASGVRGYKEIGNLKPTARRLVVNYILTSWRELWKKMTALSFRSCALTANADSTENNEISYFKPGKP